MSDHHAPTDLTHHLKGIDLPASKDDLVAHAKQNGAPEDVLERLAQLPDTEYGTMADVMKGFGKSE